MRRDAFLAASLCTLAATAALAADDTLDLARRLERYDGGVTLLLKNFEVGLAGSAAAPDIFRQSYDQAIADNSRTIAAADEQIARAYAGIYSAQQLSAEVDFYESPEGQAIVSRNRAPNGAIIWPDPNSISLSSKESAALIKFNQAVQRRAAIAAKNPKAMDQVLAAESDALIKVRTAAYANYCKIRDCKAEGVKLPPQ
ncbi:MAG TPA: hypothetical protein VN685_07315 [Rhizomicrobium sp.]|nr:hypothetical protein [Rhizomicrobium sp.]